MATNPEMHDRLEQAEEFDSLPEPLPLLGELPPVLPFTHDLLPLQLAPWVQDTAERMNCPLDLVAIPAMVAIGSLVGRRVGIRPQRNTDWLEVGNLWGAVVAPPGHLKSPAAAEALKPLRWLETKAADANEKAFEEFKLADELQKAQQRASATTIKQLLKDGKADEAKTLIAEAAEPDAPIERRYMTNDATAEKLGEVCAANPFGVMVHRDELLTLFSDLDQSEKATARGFFMAGWGGQDGYTFDRIARGTVRVRAVNLSLFGTTQPTRLAGYIRESLRRFDDGMVQRLQLLAWPDFDGDFTEVDRCPSTDARLAAYECFEEMARLNINEVRAERDEFDDPDAVPFLRFNSEAQDIFAGWRTELEHKVRGDDLPPALSAHLSKYRGLIPRLALIWHLASNGWGAVSTDATLAALRWAAYLESHARRTYASTSLDNADAARAIWRRVKRGDLPQQFTARDVYRRDWSGLGKERVEAGLVGLCEAEWLRTSEPEVGERGGRPSKLYRANPKALRA